MPTSFTVPPLQFRRSGMQLVLAISLLAALTIFFVREVADLRRSMNELRMNDLAQTEVRNVLVFLLDAETGQRGFLLTGNDAYLTPYLVGKSKVRDSLRQAETAPYQDASFLADVRDLTLLTESKLEELEQTVRLKKRGDNTGAMAVVVQGYGREKMLEARRIIQAQLDRMRLARDRTMGEFNERLKYAAGILVTILSTVVFLSVFAWRAVTSIARENNDLARQLAQEASHDALTNLPNRRFFDRWARRLVARHTRELKKFGVLLIDLDGFKQVNDLHGHATGDEVMKEAAARLQGALRGGEFLARVGGDEFVVLIEGDVNHSEATRIGKRLIESLEPSLHPKLAAGSVGASIGAALFPTNGRDLESLIEAADLALYQSKDRGRGVVTFSSRMPAQRSGSLVSQDEVSMPSPIIPAL